MPKFMIELEIPGAGTMSPQQIEGVAEKSCSVLQDLGPQIQWLQRRAMLLRTKFATYTSRPTRKWHKTTPVVEDFRPIA